MSKSRKVLGALLAVVMVLSVLSISAFAAGATSYEEDALYTQSWSLGTPVNVSGTQYKVDVILSTNYEVGPVSFKLDGVTSVDNVAVGAGYYAGALTDKSNDGRVFMVPDTTDTVVAVSCNNAVIATVTYTTNNANGAVTIAKDVKHAGNPNGSLVAARCTSGSVNKSDFVVGQTTTVSGELVYEVSGEADSADLEVKSGSAVIINTTYTLGGQYDGVVYGFTITGIGNEMANTNFITNNLQATDGSELTIKAAKGSRYGTGSTITVGDKTYVIIVFGDANSDGRINGQDVTQINKFFKGTATSTSLTQLAAQTKRVNNVSQLTAVNAQDYTEINKHFKGVLEIDQAAMATAITNTVVDAYK